MALAPKGSGKGQGNANARVNMPTSVTYQCLSLNQAYMKGFILELICGLIWIYNVSGLKDERAWNIIYDIIFVNLVTTCYFSEFQLLWQHCRSRCSPFREWWVAFRSYIGQMLDKTRNQMNNWRWDNPCAFGDQVDCSNP